MKASDAPHISGFKTGSYRFIDVSYNTLWQGGSTLETPPPAVTKVRTMP